MKRFHIENMEKLKGAFLKAQSEFILVEVFRQRMLDFPSDSHIKTQQQMADEKALKFKEKLDLLTQRLQNGFQLISNKIR